jgi:integrase/recombinase XerD
VDGRPSLRMIPGTVDAAVLAVSDDLDPFAYQARCVGSWVTSMIARGFSQTTIEGDNAVLDRFLALAGKPAWELSAADVDAVVRALLDRGTGAVTRRDYVTTFRQFFEYLEARHSADIAVRFGVKLASRIDRFHAGRHVADPAVTARTPPTPLRMDQFFAFIRARMEIARKWVPWARDYALFRLLYHCGLRSAEATALEVRDLHFGRGPFGKVHVRFGKAAKGSGPRPRWGADARRRRADPALVPGRGAGAVPRPGDCAVLRRGRRPAGHRHRPQPAPLLSPGRRPPYA